MALWHLPSIETSDPHFALLQGEKTAPVTTLFTGPVGCPWLEFRDLAEFDAWIGALVTAKADHAAAQARYDRHRAEELPPLPVRHPGAALEALEASVAPFTDPPRDEASYPYPDVAAGAGPLAIPAIPLADDPDEDFRPPERSEPDHEAEADDRAQQDAASLLERWGADPAETAALAAAPEQS